MSPDATGPQPSGGAGTRQLREQGASRELEQQPLDLYRPEEGAEAWHTLCQGCREHMEHMQSLVPGLSLEDGRAEPVEEVAVERPPELAQYPVMFMAENEWMIFTSALEEYWTSRHRRCLGYSEN